MLVNENTNKNIPDLRTLQACLSKMIANGYTEDFKAEDDGLRALRTDKVYQPQDVTVVNYFRFEGPSNPDDMSIMYVIETNDGTKGTLIDAYGTYASPEVNQFILEVERISKKVVKEEKFGE